MAVRSIYRKKKKNPIGMGPLPAGMQPMSQVQQSQFKPLQFPRQRYRTLARPQPHTPYKIAPKGRQLTQRGGAVIDANPYRTSLKALQRGTNLPVALIGGEVRGHGASSANRANQRAMQQKADIQRALANAGRAPRQVRVAGEPEADDFQRPIVDNDKIGQDPKLMAQLNRQAGIEAGAQGDSAIAQVDLDNMLPSGGGGGAGSGSSTDSNTFEKKKKNALDALEMKMDFESMQKKDGVKYGKGVKSRLQRDISTAIKERERKLKQQRAMRQTRQSLQGRPRVYMPVLDYRRRGLSI